MGAVESAVRRCPDDNGDTVDGDINGDDCVSDNEGADDDEDVDSAGEIDKSINNEGRPCTDYSTETSHNSSKLKQLEWNKFQQETPNTGNRDVPLRPPVQNDLQRQM